MTPNICRKTSGVLVCPSYEARMATSPPAKPSANVEVATYHEPQRQRRINYFRGLDLSRSRRTTTLLVRLWRIARWQGMTTTGSHELVGLNSYRSTMLGMLQLLHQTREWIINTPSTLEKYRDETPTDLDDRPCTLRRCRRPSRFRPRSSRARHNRHSSLLPAYLQATILRPAQP